jgi:hypothetical protein
MDSATFSNTHIGVRYSCQAYLGNYKRLTVAIDYEPMTMSAMMPTNSDAPRQPLLPVYSVYH